MRQRHRDQRDDGATLSSAHRGESDPVAPGQFVTYELTVTNHGPDEAVQVKVTMPIPGGLTGGCVRLSDDAATPGGCFTGRDIVWTLDTIPAGTSRTVVASFDAVTSLADGTILPAAASVVDAAGSSARVAVSTIFLNAAAYTCEPLTKSADPCWWVIRVWPPLWQRSAAAAERSSADPAAGNHGT